MNRREIVGGLIVVAFFASFHPASARAQAAPSTWEKEHGAGWAAYREGRLDEAEGHLKAAAREAKAFGADDPRTATTLDHLAWVRMARGDFAAAEPLARWALDCRQRVRPKDHPEVAESLNTMACLFDAQGKYAEAEPFYRRALEIEEKAKGPESPTVAALLDNLGTVLHAQGRLAAAEPLYRRALAIREKTSGPSGADLAPTLQNLGVLLLATNRPGEAEPLLRRALAIREKNLGAGHPDVAETLARLAQIDADRGRLAEAERLYRRALAILEPNDGHPATLEVLDSYALLLRRADRDDDADRVEARAQKLRDRAAGNERRGRPARLVAAGTEPGLGQRQGAGRAVVVGEPVAAPHRCAAAGHAVVGAVPAREGRRRAGRRGRIIGVSARVIDRPARDHRPDRSDDRARRRRRLGPRRPHPRRPRERERARDQQRLRAASHGSFPRSRWL